MKTKKILGLDLGTDSIGWALVEVDEHNQGEIIAGVNIPKASKDDEGTELRRLKRQTRRQFFRTRLRKLHLIQLLIQHNMFPSLPKEDRVKRIQAKKLDAALRHFFSINSYEQRKRAASGEPLSLHELGRVFYHLAQRRGYKENRLAGSEGEEESGVLYSGDPASGKTGIEQTLKAMQDQTLGQYLSSLDTRKERIRNRYTLRSMYMDEFEVIWEKQQPHPSASAYSGTQT